MSTDIETSDAELEALMAELEAQNEQIAAATKATPVTSAPASSPAPVAAPTPAAQEPAPEPAETVAAASSEAAQGGVAVGEEDLAELEAELEALDSSDAGIPAEVTPPVSAPESLPTPAVEKLEKNGTALDDEPGVLAGGALADAGLIKDRRVVMNEDGTVKQPAMNFSRPEPKRPTEMQGPGGLQHYVDVDQFREDTRVTEINLDQCMIEQNGLRAWYGALAARAEAQASRVKAKFEVVEATLYDHHRKELAASGEKTTEKMVENAVKLDPRWLKAKNMVIEAETIAAINKGLVESIKDRRDMIIQLGADRRDEYKGAARVLAERQEREDLHARAGDAARRAMAERAA